MAGKVFFIGMPGSGKSTLARELAGLLNVPFLDLDDLIVKQEGRTIPQIFEEKGESYFREAESRCLKKAVAAKNDFVMATGGGTPCFFDGIRVMIESGTVIFIDVPTTELANRIREQGKNSRPLLARLDQSDIGKTLDRILFDRKPFYSKAHLAVGPETRAAELRKWLTDLRTNRPR